MEIAFQAAALVALLVIRARHWQVGQHFHLYLVAYGLFRFGHEFLRETPKPFGGLSGYQILALPTATAAMIAYRRRAVSGTGPPEKQVVAAANCCGTDRKLRSPVVDLTGVAEATLSFAQSLDST